MNMNANLLVYFENSPSQEQRQRIKDEVHSFLLTIDPEASPKITTGEGSWWITIFWWAGEQFLEWLASKGFDTALKEVKKQLSHNKESTEKKNQIEALGSNSSSKSTMESTNYSSFDYSSLYKSMNDLMNTVAQEQGGKTKIVLGLYNNSSEIGRVIALTKEDKDVTFSIMQTDSKDDYNSLTNP
jgi:hypothetical protein